MNDEQLSTAEARVRELEEAIVSTPLEDLPVD